MGLSSNELLDVLIDYMNAEIADYLLNGMSQEYLKGEIDGILATLEVCNLSHIAKRLQKYINSKIDYEEW